MCKLKLYCKIASNREFVENEMLYGYHSFVHRSFMRRLVSARSVYDYRILQKWRKNLLMDSGWLWWLITHQKLHEQIRQKSFVCTIPFIINLKRKKNICRNIQSSNWMNQTPNTTPYNSMGCERRHNSWNKLEMWLICIKLKRKENQYSKG